MSRAGGIEAALACLLTAERGVARFHAGELDLQRDFCLSDDEVAILRGLDVRRVEMNAHLVRGKRLDFVCRAAPQTVEVLKRLGLGRVVSDYLLQTHPTVDESLETARSLHEGRRLLRYLRGQAQSSVPAWVIELATFELCRFELLASPSARLAARAARDRAALPSASQALAGHETLVVAGHVRWLRQQYDVLRVDAAAVSPAWHPPRAPGVITLVRQPRSGVEAYRTGPGAAAVLELCERPTPVAQVYAALDAFGDPRARAWLEQALQLGTLQLGTLQLGTLQRGTLQVEPRDVEGE